MELGLTVTSVIRSLRYYSHFFWPPGKTAINFLVQKKPSLLRSPIKTANFFGPLVTVLTGLHCKFEVEQRKLDLKNLDNV